MDGGSVSTEFFNNMAKEINRDDNYAAPRLQQHPSENACSRFGDSICNDHSSELCCDGCGEPFYQWADHDNLACHGVVCGSGLNHYVGRPRVGYDDGAQPNPDMGYDDEDPGYFGGARRGPRGRYGGEGFGGCGDYHHGNNNVDIDHQSVGGGHV